MKNNRVKWSILFVSLFCGTASVFCQQTISNPEINRLKNEVQRRELIDRSDAILPQDKEINRVNLEKARAKLRVSLQTLADAKRKLKSMLGDSITTEESQNIDSALQSLEAELQSISNGGQETQPAGPTPASTSQTTTANPNAEVITSPTGGSGPATVSSTSNAPSSTTRPASAPSPLPSPMSSSAASSARTTTATNSLVGSRADLLPIRSCQEVKRLSDQDPKLTSHLEKFFCLIVNRIEKTKATSPTSPLSQLELRRDFYAFMIALLGKEGRAQYVLAAEEERVDKQVGADASQSGSTSLVSKGSVPSILGFAVDSGALLKSSSGSTVTFRGNIIGLAKALADKGFISGYDEDSSAARFLRRTSFSLSYDPTRGQEPGVFTGSRQQLAGYSVRLDIYNKRDARNPAYKKDWTDFLSSASEALVAQTDSSLRAMTDIAKVQSGPLAWNDPTLQSWFVITNDALRTATPDQVEQVFLERLSNVPNGLSEATLAELHSFDIRFKGWLDARENILDKIARAPIVTFEYTAERPLNAPDLSKFQLIAEKGLKGKSEFTFNGLVTIFNQKPAMASASRIRDFQFALQFDVPFGELGLGIGKPVLSFAGRYERLMSDAMISNSMVAKNTKGDIGVGQVKLTIPVKNSGVRIPLSISYATRTELIKEKQVRGNFGFTFDLDTMFAKFKPF